MGNFGSVLLTLVNIKSFSLGQKYNLSSSHSSSLNINLNTHLLSILFRSLDHQYRQYEQLTTKEGVRYGRVSFEKLSLHSFSLWLRYRIRRVWECHINNYINNNRKTKEFNCIIERLSRWLLRYINIIKAIVVDQWHSWSSKFQFGPELDTNFEVNHDTDNILIVLLSLLTSWVRLSQYLEINKYYNFFRWNSKKWWILEDLFYILQDTDLCDSGWCFRCRLQDRCCSHRACQALDPKPSMFISDTFISIYSTVFLDLHMHMYRLKECIFSSSSYISNLEGLENHYPEDNSSHLSNYIY